MPGRCETQGPWSRHGCAFRTFQKASRVRIFAFSLAQMDERLQEFKSLAGDKPS
jgi:hypothetical protein